MSTQWKLAKETKANSTSKLFRESCDEGLLKWRHPTTSFSPFLLSFVRRNDTKASTSSSSVQSFKAKYRFFAVFFSLSFSSLFRPHSPTRHFMATHKWILQSEDKIWDITSNETETVSGWEKLYFILFVLFSAASMFVHHLGESSGEEKITRRWKMFHIFIWFRRISHAKTSPPPQPPTLSIEWWKFSLSLFWEKSKWWWQFFLCVARLLETRISFTSWKPQSCSAMIHPFVMISWKKNIAKWKFLPSLLFHFFY